MSDTTVSIILPAFNAETGLRRALGRILTACPVDGEIILIDDGSADKTLDIMKHFANPLANAKVIEVSANGGVANARNLALREAVGDYVWFVDWDDEWSPDIVRKLYLRAITTDADIVVCGAKWKTPSGLELGRAEDFSGPRELHGTAGVEAVLRGHLKGYLWTKLFKRSSLPPNMFPIMQSQSDFCGSVPVIAAAERIVVDPTILYWHVIRDGSITNTRDPRLENLTLCREVINSCAEEIPQTRRLQRLRQFYDYAFWSLARVNTAVRLSSPDRARLEVRAVLQHMRWRDVPRLAVTSPAIAAKSAVVLLTRAHYPAVRQRLVQARAWARKIRTSSH
jgi:hypothetical protein